MRNFCETVEHLTAETSGIIRSVNLRYRLVVTIREIRIYQVLVTILFLSFCGRP